MMFNNMILASNSPRRLQLLQDIGYHPTVFVPHIDETPLEGEAPQDLVTRLAANKAQYVYAKLQDIPGSDTRTKHSEYRSEDTTVIVAADTVVWKDNICLGKPASSDDAIRMLNMLSDSTHCVSTGVCVLSFAAQAPKVQKQIFVETTQVSFFPLSQAEIEEYVVTGEPLDKAGAYAIQGMGRLFVEAINGDYFNVVGLPIARLARILQTIDSPHIGAQHDS